MGGGPAPVATHAANVGGAAPAKKAARRASAGVAIGGQRRVRVRSSACCYGSRRRLGRARHRSRGFCFRFFSETSKLTLVSFFVCWRASVFVRALTRLHTKLSTHATPCWPPPPAPRPARRAAPLTPRASAFRRRRRTRRKCARWGCGARSRLLVSRCCGMGRRQSGGREGGRAENAQGSRACVFLCPACACATPSFAPGLVADAGGPHCTACRAGGEATRRGARPPSRVEGALRLCVGPPLAPRLETRPPTRPRPPRVLLTSKGAGAGRDAASNEALRTKNNAACKGRAVARFFLGVQPSPRRLTHTTP